MSRYCEPRESNRSRCFGTSSEEIKMHNSGLVLFGFAIQASVALLGQGPPSAGAPPGITLTKAVPYYSSQTLVIHGTDFAPTAAVTLGTVALTVQKITSTSIVAALP